MKLIAWCCLLISATAQAQPGPPRPGLTTVVDTSLLQRAHIGQPFPFSEGVHMELSLFRRVREQSLRADTVMAGLENRVATLNTMLRTAQLRYLNCAGALDESQLAGQRQQGALTKVYKFGQQADRQRRRARWDLRTPGAAIVGTVAGALGLFLGYQIADF